MSRHVKDVPYPTLLDDEVKIGLLPLILPCLGFNHEIFVYRFIQTKTNVGEIKSMPYLKTGGGQNLS